MKYTYNLSRSTHIPVRLCVLVCVSPPRCRVKLTRREFLPLAMFSILPIGVYKISVTKK